MRKLLVALGATFVVLLGTGLYQAYRYVPTAATVGPGSASRHGFVYRATEIGHLVGSVVFVVLAVAVVVAGARRVRATSRGSFLAVVVLVVMMLATLAAIITGRGLRWDQVALFAVSTRTDLRGLFMSDHVRFVLIGTNELSPSEFSSRVFLHLVLFPVGLLIVGGVLWFLSVRDDRRGAALAGSPSAPDGNDDTDLDDLEEAPT